MQQVIIDFGLFFLIVFLYCHLRYNTGKEIDKSKAFILKSAENGAAMYLNELNRLSLRLNALSEYIGIEYTEDPGAEAREFIRKVERETPTVLERLGRAERQAACYSIKSDAEAFERSLSKDLSSETIEFSDSDKSWEVARITDREWEAIWSVSRSLRYSASLNNSEYLEHTRLLHWEYGHLDLSSNDVSNLLQFSDTKDGKLRRIVFDACTAYYAGQELQDRVKFAYGDEVWEKVKAELEK